MLFEWQHAETIVDRSESRPSGLLIEIRQNLRDERIRRRMSQLEVASLMGCSRKRVSEFELGLVDASFDFVAGYCALLGASVEFIAPTGDHVDYDHQ